MLPPPPPYTRYFNSRIIEIPSDSEDKETPTPQPKHPTRASTMTQMDGQTSTPTRQGSSRIHQVPRPNTNAPSTRAPSNAPRPPFFGGRNLLQSSMPHLQPILVEDPQNCRPSATWPAPFNVSWTSPQVLATTGAPASTLAPARTPRPRQVRTPSTIDASPSGLLSISDPVINELVSDALDRYLSNQRPGMRATRVNVNGSYEDASTIKFQDMGTPLAKWFAVTRGRYPGIYNDLQEALQALNDPKLGQFEFCKSEADASVLFVRALKSGSVGVIQNGKLYAIGPGMPLF